jgi:hypothetical protein
MNFYEMVEQVEKIVGDYVATLDEVLPEDLGLDRRVAYRLYITDNVIAVSKSEDRTLQYYGGFEYVDREYRKEFGDWVLYSGESDRVDRHLCRFYEAEMKEDE